ncbi:HotDog domain-containing protein [Jimgerdemannia flammicorona]|uniref:HotDog domain-containing protein n=1 Tax=Jimgerdemannia flammicorona TaxID=994334 RepID=A0A433QWS2_9FUNG|nr:HotDog domain-containing protein [Jimgerdemannia flammicorona]
MAPKTLEFDLSKAVGYQNHPAKVAYNRRDLLLYALSIGIDADELNYLYELDPNFTPFPTYPLVLQLKGNTFDVNSYAAISADQGTVPGVPPFDLNRLVHGEQYLEVLRKLPHEGNFDLKNEVLGVYDKGSGLVIERCLTMVDAKGVEYVKMITKVFVIGYGGWGGPKGPKSVTRTLPNRATDAVEVTTTSRNAALLYRLSGYAHNSLLASQILVVFCSSHPWPVAYTISPLCSDYNPLHADPTIAPKIGFERAILHGLCSYGTAAHAIVKHLAANDSDRFVSIDARFAKPVYPGDTLETHMWKVDGAPAGHEHVYFIVKVKERDVVVISNGLVVLRKGDGKSKL